MTPEKKFELVGIAFGLAGIVCVGVSAGWLAAIGVFLMMWGDAMVNYVNRQRRIESRLPLKRRQTVVDPTGPNGYSATHGVTE